MTQHTIPDYTPRPGMLEGRVILVTGAGDGIGKAVALACARHGAELILLGKTIPKLEATYDAIKQRGGHDPAIYPMNLAGAAREDYDALAARLDETFGRLDGLVHNAAILGALAPIALSDPATWHQVMQVNLHAPYLLTRACLPLLNKANDASIIFVSDRVGRAGRAYWGAYGVAKAGLENLMQIVADETSDTGRVRANSLDTGFVRTQFFTRAYPGRDPNELPLPEDVTKAFLYLLGPDSHGITGQQYRLTA
jgi:NAD(P)-dependent dehydrogenase (short-subunit alcohol dehydrogenase family)